MFKFSFEVSSCINKILFLVINYTERGEKTLDIWTVRSPVLDPKWRLVRRGSSPRFLTREDLLILRCQTSSKHWNSKKLSFYHLNIMGTASKSSFLRSLIRRTSAILRIAQTWQHFWNLSSQIREERTPLWWSLDQPSTPPQFSFSPQLWRHRSERKRKH